MRLTQAAQVGPPGGTPSVETRIVDGSITGVPTPSPTPPTGPSLTNSVTTASQQPSGTSSTSVPLTGSASSTSVTTSTVSTTSTPRPTTTSVTTSSPPTTSAGAPATTATFTSTAATGVTSSPSTVAPPIGPTCIVTDIVYKVRAKSFLRAADDKVLMCADVKNVAYCKDVKFYSIVEGKRRAWGDFTVQSGAYCRYINTAEAEGSPNYAIEAVPISSTPNAYLKPGVPFARDLPQFVPRRWFVDLFGGSLGPFGSGDDWGYNRGLKIVPPFKKEFEMNLGFLKGKASFKGNLEYKMSVDGFKNGKADMYVIGGFSVSVEPPRVAPGSGSLSFTGGANFATKGIAGNLYVPELDGFTIALDGEVAVPTPFVYDLTVPVPLIGDVGAKVYVQLLVKGNLNAFFKFKEDNTPLPVDFPKLTGSIGFGFAITGKASALASATITGKMIASVLLSWTDSFKITGVRGEVNADFKADVFGATISFKILAMDWTLNFNKRNDMPFALRQTSQWTPITATWNPVTPTRTPAALLALNIYPTNIPAMASSSSVDLVVLTTITQATSQMAYTVRNGPGAMWSALASIPKSSASVDMPALAAVSANSFVLVVAAASDPGQFTNVQLMFATYDAGANTWTAYAPVLASPGVDMMPAISRDGKMVAFVRNPASANAQLMTVALGTSSSPVLVATTTSRYYSIDHSDAGSVLVYQEPTDSSLTVCTMPTGKAAWSCKASTRSANFFSVVSFAAPLTAFALVYSDVDAQTLRVDSLLPDGTSQRSTSASITGSAMTTLTVTPSGRADNSFVGWDSCYDVGKCAFYYALIDGSGNVWASPASVEQTAQYGDGQTWSPLASILTANGNKIVHASTLISAVEGSTTAQGALSVTDLKFTAKFNVSGVTFSPADFTGSSVDIRATITNVGILPLNPDGTNSVTFSFNGAMFAQQRIRTLQPGASVDLTVNWPFRASQAGGKISISYSGTDDLALVPYVIDPCQYSIDDNVTVSSVNNQASLIATLSAPGMCGGNVPVTVMTRADDPTSPWAVLATASVPVTPFYAGQITIPIATTAIAGSGIQMTVTGTNQMFTLTTVLAVDQYDFLANADTFTVGANTVGTVSVTFTVCNAGLSSASGVPVVAQLLSPDGTFKSLATTTVSLGAMQLNQPLTMTLPLTAAVNNVRFIINDPSQPQFPETYVANNVFNMAVEVTGGSADGSWVTPPGMYPESSSSKKLSKGALAAIVVVCVLVGLAVIGGVAYLLMKGKGKSAPHDDVHYSKIADS